MRLDVNGAAAAAGSMAIGGAVSGGTSGSIPYIDSGITLQQDNANHFWDATNHRLGIGNIVPGVQVQATQNSGFGTFTGTGATTIDAIGVFNSVVSSAKSASLIVTPLFANLELSLTGTPTFYAPLGLNASVLIRTTDDAVYAAASFIAGGFYQGTYSGTGSIPSAYGIQASAVRGGTGALTNLIGLDIITKHTAGATSGTTTTVKGINVNRPIGIAGSTMTTNYGVYIDNQTTAAGTQTNTPYGLYQVGTGDHNFFGGALEAGAALAVAQSPAAGYAIPAGYSMYVSDVIEPADGTSIDIGDGAVLEIG